MLQRIGVFAACVFAASPIAAQTVISASNANWIVDGDQTDAQLGQMRPAGDVDGDGFDDVLIGAALFDGAFVDSGRIFLYRGGPNGLGNAPAWTLDGDRPQAFLGLGLGVGDLNADGFDDVAVPDGGRTLLFLGSAAGLPATPSQVLMDSGILAGGEVNGDGFGDLVVGGGHSLRLYRGNSAGLENTSSWSVTLPGSVTGVVLDDLTGDGLADPAYTTFEEKNSKKYGKLIVHKAAAGVLPTSATRTVDLDLQHGALLPVVLSAGDVYGNGHGNLAVGLLGLFLDQPGTARPEAALLFDGTQSGVRPTATVVADQIPPGALVDLGSGGDLTGDGFGEFLVAEAHDSLFGSPYPPFHRLLVFRGGGKGPSDAPTTIIEAEGQFDGFPRAVTNAGDVNGDGFADLLIGAPFFSGDESREGRVYVFYGGSSF